MGRLMNKVGLLAGGALLVISSGSIVAARIHHQQEWKQAFRAALDSGERAFDYRETGMLTFNSKLQAFEVAYGALQRLDPPSALDSFKATALGKCRDDLKLYRTNQNMWTTIRGLELTLYSEKLSTQTSNLTKEQINDSQGLAKTAENCLIDLER